MRTWILPVLSAVSLLAACDGSSSTSGGNGGGGAGGETASTSDGGGGSSSSGMTTTDTETTGTGMTTTDTMTTDPGSDGCNGAGSSPVSFANDVQPIFLQSCGSTTTCHLKSSPSEGLSLKAGEAFASLVDVPAKQACNGQVRVAPGDAAASYVVNKITNTGICQGQKKMPPSTSLSTAKQQTIIDWICQGAENN